MTDVLGIPVTPELLARWAAWFAPDPQPFVVPSGSDLAGLGSPVADVVAADGLAGHEWRDSFEIYQQTDGTVCRAIGSVEFAQLPRDVRASLVRGQVEADRALVPAVRSWPAPLLHGRELEVLVPYVEEGRRLSRHREVPDAVWRSADRLLPGLDEPDQGPHDARPAAQRPRRRLTRHRMG